MTALTTFEKEEYSKRLTRLKRWKDDTIQAGIDLAYIQHSKCYRDDYDTFEEFCQKEFGLTDTHARRMIDFAGLKNTPIGGFIENESQAREILKVPERHRERVLNEAKESGAITAKSIKASAMKEKPQIELDREGYAIPVQILDEWKRADKSRELLAYISKVKCFIEKGIKDNDPIFREVNPNLTASLTNVYGDIKRLIPHAVCTSCQGRNSQKCTFCKGRGFISSFLFETCVPEEIKYIRRRASVPENSK